MAQNPIVFADFIQTQLAGPISNTATVANLQSGAGALFPTILSGQYLVLTFNDANTGKIYEIVHVTNVSVDTITIVRGQEGTTAQSWAAGDLVFSGPTAGQMQSLVQTGNALFTIGAATNLKGSSAGGVTTASWTVTEIIAETAIGGIGYRGTNLSLAFNGANVGIDGMDTGTMPVSGDLSIYAVYDPTTDSWGTLGCLGSVSNGPVYTGSHMPAGYTASTLLGVVVTDGSGHFQDFQQIERTVWVGNPTVLSGGAALSPTAVSLSSVIPVVAKTVGGNGSTTGGADLLLQSSASNVIGFQSIAVGSGGSAVGNFGPLPLITPQEIFYAVTAGTGTISINWFTF